MCDRTDRPHMPTPDILLGCALVVRESCGRRQLIEPSQPARQEKLTFLLGWLSVIPSCLRDLTDSLYQVEC